MCSHPAIVANVRTEVLQNAMNVCSLAHSGQVTSHFFDAGSLRTFIPAHTRSTLCNRDTGRAGDPRLRGNVRPILLGLEQQRRSRQTARLARFRR